MKRVPDVKALVSHARTMKRMKMAEHRGYARAICELMQINFDGLDQIAKPWEGAPGKATLENIVWPPIVVLENTRTVKGSDGLWKGVEPDELNEVLEGEYSKLQKYPPFTFTLKHVHKLWSECKYHRNMNVYAPTEPPNSLNVCAT